MIQKTVDYLGPLVGEWVDAFYPAIQGVREASTTSGILGVEQYAFNVEPGCGGFGVHYDKKGETRFMLLFPGATVKCMGKEYVLE